MPTPVEARPGIRARAREYWEYRELFVFLLWRNIKTRYAQTVLGASWAVVQPFFTMVVFTVFFGNFARIPSDGVPYPVFSYTALLPWTFFQTAVTQASQSLTANPELLTKVYFPRVALPASAVLAGLVDLAIASVILVGMMAYYGLRPSSQIFLIPILIVPLVLFTLGVGMIAAAANVRFRDVKHLIPFVLQIWLFLTPIIYPTSIVPERLRPLLDLNPLGGLIEAFRGALLPDKAIDYGSLGLAVGVTVVVFVAGSALFHRTERYFADVI